MGDGIEIKHNAEELASFFRDIGMMEMFRLGSSRVQVATSRAINDTLNHMAVDVSRRISKIYYVGVRAVKANMRIKRANTAKNQTGKLEFCNRWSIPLSKFSPKQNKSFVSVKVLRQNRARRIQPGGKDKIAVTSKGKAAVWIAKGHVLARTDGERKARDAWAMFGPSFMSFFSKPGIPEQLDDEAYDWLMKRLEHQLQFISNKSNLTNFGRGK